MNPLIKFSAEDRNNKLPGIAILNQFAEFRKGWTDESAKAKIDEMVRNGQVTNEQVEQARQMAERLKGLIR